MFFLHNSNPDDVNVKVSARLDNPSFTIDPFSWIFVTFLRVARDRWLEGVIWLWWQRCWCYISLYHKAPYMGMIKSHDDHNTIISYIQYIYIDRYIIIIYQSYMRGPFLWYIFVNGILCILYHYMFNVHWIYGLFARYDVDIVLAPRFLELRPNPIHITTKRHSAGPLRVSCCTKSADTSLGLC